MTALVILVVLASGGLYVASTFVRWEREGRRERVVAAVFAAVLVDLLLYASQNDQPPGIFRPVLAGQSFRLPELLIVVALLARLVVHGGPKRMSPVGVAWAAFGAWYLLAGMFGLFSGHPIEPVLYQAKAVLYLAGGVGLLAGVDPARLVTRQAIGTWFIAVGAVAAVMFPLTMREANIWVGLPGLSVPSLGEIGPDASSALVIIGTAGLLVEGCRRQRRGLIGLAALPMVLSVFSATQRAAMLGLAAAAVGVIIAALGPTWRRRLRTQPTTIFLVLVAFATVAVAFAMVEVRKGERLPVAQAYEETFEATGKQQSADVRLLLWREADRLFDERPILGHGLAVPFEVRVPLTNLTIDSGFHNIIYDVLTRSGLVGLALLSIASGLSLREGLLAWRRHADGRVAALALAAVIGIGSLATKGMFEDVFEKHRLATLGGMLFGVMVVAGQAVRERRDTDEDVVQVDDGMSPVRPVRAEVPAWS